MVLWANLNTVKKKEESHSAALGAHFSLSFCPPFIVPLILRSPPPVCMPFAGQTNWSSVTFVA